jgi:hypothetical protein
MAIPNKQIGWSNESNLLWEISKQLDTTINLMCTGPCPTTTTTSTTVFVKPFSGTIYWGEDANTACSQTIPISVEGDGTTFCNSTILTGSEFSVIGTGGVFISLGGQIRTASHVSGDEFVTFTGGCEPCSVINTNYTFRNINDINCNVVTIPPYNYFDVWMIRECIDIWPQIGCEVWNDEAKTLPFPSGNYPIGDGSGCVVITDGVVTAIP